MPWKETTVVSIREEFVLKALEPRTNLAAVCREFGVSRKTGYKWLERYKSGGVLALRDLSRRSRTSPLGVSPEVIVDLVAIRNAHPRWGARKLIWALEQSGAKSIPSERTSSSPRSFAARWPGQTSSLATSTFAAAARPVASTVTT